MAAGDFAASALPDALLKINDLFSGQRLTPELNLPIDVIQNMGLRQTVRLQQVPELLDAGNCRGVKAAFLKKSTRALATTIAACEITATENESSSVTLADNLLYVDSFSISEVDCKDVFTVAEKLAHGLATSMATIENAVNQAAVSFLAANAQDNNATLPDTWDNSDADLIGIPSDSLTPEALAEIFYQAQINNLYSPFLVSGRNLFVSKVLSDFRSQGSDNVDAIFRSPLGDIVFDPRTVDQVTAMPSTFAVDPSAYAFWSSNQFMNEAPEGWDDQYNTYVWKMRAPRLTWRNGGSEVPVYFDVKRQTLCATDSDRNYRVFKYQIIFRGGLQLGPSVVGASETGVLHYKAV